MSDEVERWRSMAFSSFALLSKWYKWGGNYWQLGHAFDTMIDYFDVVDRTEAAVSAEIVIDRFQKTEGYWYDDFGWWGVACLRASQRDDLFGAARAAQFKTIALKCWNFMNSADRGDMEIICWDTGIMRGAPNVWRGYDSRFAELEPRVDGGVWNRDWKWSTMADPCYCVPIYRSPKNFFAKDGLSGFQNTVTNALYLALASRINKTINVVNEAHREYNFLSKWLHLQDADADPLLYDLGPDKGNARAVVRERVTAYKKRPNQPLYDVWAYRPQLAWAGDQGLMVSALVDYMEAFGQRDDLTNLCKSVIRGSIFYLTDHRPDSDTKGLLLNWWDPDPNNHNSPPGGDAGNYVTGSGVFWRCLLHAFRKNPQLKALIKESGDFIRTNANAPAHFAQDDRGPIDDMVVVHANDLGRAVAGMEFLR